MEDKIRSNIIFSFIEKLGIIASQFISSILISRYLPREEFGSLAVISGAFAFIQFINLSIENVLIKDYQELKSSISECISQFIQLNLLKVLLISLCCLGVGLGYYLKTEQETFLYASFSLLSVLIMDILISPLILYSSLLFKQQLVTKISLIRWGLNVVGLCFLIPYPSIRTVVLKDIAILFLILALWFHESSRDLELKLKPASFDWTFLKKNLLGYSIWVHLIGVISNLVYKADAFILFYFVSLKMIGNYNIALTVANVANIIPSILINQNNVALSHCHTDEDSKMMTGKFLRFSLYIGFMSLLGFFLLGKFYLRLITKGDVDEIYEYLMYIVSGLLIVKMLISPLVSYINIKGNVKNLFFRVQLPLLFIVLFNYSIFSSFLGARGAAMSNLLNGILWLLLIYIESKSYKFKISYIGSFKDDYNQVKNYVKKKLAPS